MTTFIKTLHIRVLLVCIALLPTTLTQAQEADKQQLELADIWMFYKFYPKSAENIRWSETENQYTDYDVENGLVQLDISDQEAKTTLATNAQLIGEEEGTFKIQSYTISPDGKKVLIVGDRKKIYRRSSTVTARVYDFETDSSITVFDGEAIGYPTFSPDGQHLGFTHNNDLYLMDLTTGESKAITTDGKQNKIINGSTDWVHEEEFAFSKAFHFSHSGNFIVYYRFDESAVKQFNMDIYGDLYPDTYEFKYPKAGENNAKVQLFMYNVKSGTTKEITFPVDEELYYPRMWWSPTREELVVYTLNRHQNHVRLFRVYGESAEVAPLMEEKSETWLDEPDDHTFHWLDNGAAYIWQSERTGYKHLYLYDRQGTLLYPLTEGPWEVTELHGADQKNNRVYFSAAEQSPIERHVYSVKLDGKKADKPNRLTREPGWHSASFSPDFKYFIDNHSAHNRIPKTELRDAYKGKPVRTLEPNDELRETHESYDLPTEEFIEVKGAAGNGMNAWMIKPTDFDASKKYPLFVYVYGGPGSQTVTNKYDGFTRMFLKYIADQGYVVVSMDGRGTGGRGRDYEKATYLQLGKLEIEDQIAGVQSLLRDYKFLDRERVGMFGWSFGGYMSLLALTKGTEAFTTAVAVAPVTNWRYYDTIYTERFLRTPQENAGGYDDNSPISHVKQFDGKLLMIHGTADDNVHFQNSVDFTSAMINAGKQFQTFYYPNKDHAIAGGITRYHLFQMMEQFLEQNLKTAQ